MDAILGKNLIVSVNGTAIAGAKSCRLQISGENIERASATNATWREFIAGRKTWTVACDHLLPRTGTPLRSSAAMALPVAEEVGACARVSDGSHALGSEG